MNFVLQTEDEGHFSFTSLEDLLMYRNIYAQIDQAIDHIQAGKVNEGLSQLQMIMAYAKEDPDIAFQLADIFYGLGHVETALSLMQEIEPFFEEISTDTQIDVRTLRAEIMIDLGQLDEAMDELLSCIQLEPDHVRSAILLADIYLMQNLPEVACRYLESILEQNPEEHDVAFILSEIYLDMGEYIKASSLLGELEYSGYQDKVKISKAKLCSHTGRFEEAHSLFQQALEEDPTSIDALVGCAVTSLQLDAYEETIFYCEQLLAIDQDHIGAYQVKGEALQKQDRLEEAKSIYEEALARNDQEEAILLKLIEVPYLMGDIDEAERYLYLLLELNEENELGLEWKNRLMNSIQN